MNYSTLTKAELIELLKEKDNLIAKLENKTYIYKGKIIHWTDLKY